MEKKKGKTDTTSIKISRRVHRMLKIHIAQSGGNMTKFADDCIEEKIRSVKGVKFVGTGKQINGFEKD